MVSLAVTRGGGGATDLRRRASRQHELQPGGELVEVSRDERGHRVAVVGPVALGLVQRVDDDEPRRRGRGQGGERRDDRAPQGVRRVAHARAHGERAEQVRRRAQRRAVRRHAVREVRGETVHELGHAARQRAVGAAHVERGDARRQPDGRCDGEGGGRPGSAGVIRGHKHLK